MSNELMTYKYNYSAKLSRGFYMTKKKLFSVIILLIALPFILLYAESFFWIVWIIIFLFTLFGFNKDKRIILTPRYVLCGDKVVYYHNISTIKLDNHSGKMLINCHGVSINMVIDKEKFPTNANKPHKIARNKKEKFKKVSDKIISKTRALNPTATIDIEGYNF